MGWLERLPGKAIDAARGRHTLFAFAFFITGNVMHWYHRLDGTYIAFMSTMMAFVLGHSIKEDWSARQGGAPPDAPPGGSDADPKA